MVAAAAWAVFPPPRSSAGRDVGCCWSSGTRSSAASPPRSSGGRTRSTLRSIRSRRERTTCSPRHCATWRSTTRSNSSGPGRSSRSADARLPLRVPLGPTSSSPRWRVVPRRGGEHSGLHGALQAGPPRGPFAAAAPRRCASSRRRSRSIPTMFKYRMSTLGEVLDELFVDERLKAVDRRLVAVLRAAAVAAVVLHRRHADDIVPAGGSIRLLAGAHRRWSTRSFRRSRAGAASSSAGNGGAQDRAKRRARVRRRARRRTSRARAGRRGRRRRAPDVRGAARAGGAAERLRAQAPAPAAVAVSGHDLRRDATWTWARSA